MSASQASRRPVRRGCAAAGALLLLAACGGAAPQAADAPSGSRQSAVRYALFTLAADSMEGRMTGSAGSARAARFIAGELRRHGVAPAFPAAGPDSAYFQPVPMARVMRPDGRARLVLLPGPSDLDTVPAERQVRDVNVIGILPGSDPELREEAVLVGAHFDHLGVGRPLEGDSVYNGADDDASGVVAVLEIARALARGQAPRRTVVFLLTTGEESGLLGTRWYIRHPVLPLERTVADLQIEMIARPDSLAGGPGRAWLTGYERSTMGDMLAAAGVPVVPDPRPEHNFFLRSDNIAFACLGIPAHTLSSYGMHTDYHTPRDEAGRADVEHMARVIDSAVEAVRRLANGPAPAWHPQGSPAENSSACRR